MMLLLLLRARFPFSIFIHFAIKFHNVGKFTNWILFSISLSLLRCWLIGLIIAIFQIPTKKREKAKKFEWVSKSQENTEEKLKKVRVWMRKGGNVQMNFYCLPLLTPTKLPHILTWTHTQCNFHNRTRFDKQLSRCLRHHIDGNREQTTPMLPTREYSTKNEYGYKLSYSRAPP